MKHNYGKRIVLGAIGMLLLLTGWAQTVNYQIYTKRYYTGYGNSDFWTTDDPRWLVLFYDNVDAYAAGEGVLSAVDDGLDGPAWNDPADFLCRTRNNTAATSIKVKLQAWEDDGGNGDAYDGDDDNYCSSLLGPSVNFRTDPICTWNTYTFYCSPQWGVEYRIYWEWATAPTITTQPSPADRNVCVGTATTLTVVGGTSARFYQWQVGSGTDCAGASGWTNIGGANSASYVPPQTPGTRVYRCLLSSNCTADFNSKTTASNCVRVNYFPYAPAIQSSVCGSNTTIGSTQPFSVLLPPSVGAIANGSYTWSVSPAGPAISAPTSPSTNITFPAAGSYTITLTTDDNGGPCASSSSTCTITVNAPDCEFVYVDPSTANTTGGSSNSPVNLTAAMGLISSSRRHVRIIGGTFNSLPTITIPTTVTASNIILEGGYVNTGGVWTKSSSATTVLNFVGTETINTDVGHVIGIKAVNTSGLTLQDLTINTAAASGLSGSGNGLSNYGVYLSGSSGWSIVRCVIASGNATNGQGATTAGHQGTASDPYDGNTGSAGGIGGNGGGGGCSTTDCEAGNGGAGGSAGAGGSSPVGNAGTTGGNGGAGGAGGDEDDCTGATGNCLVNQNSSGRNGAAGAGGSCATGGCGGTGSGGAAGTNGNSCGTTGSAGTSGTTGTAAHTSGYFVPGAGSNGTGGSGGGSGGGGGGGSWRSDCGLCDDDSGSGGGAGGGGGGGGGGAKGGRGGGGTFAIYSWNNSGTCAVTNCSLSAGSSVTSGGAGGTGGPGAAAGGGGTGPSNCEGVGKGGNGGSGAAGGAGGNGGTGAAGARIAIAHQGGGTAPANDMSLTLNTSTNGGSVTNPSGTLSVNYNNTKGCTNSYITLNKSAGTWTNYGAGGDEVFDITSGLQSNTTASNPVSVFYTGTGWKDISTSTDTRARLLYISTSRTPPVINGATSPLCKDGTLSLSCTPNSPSSVVGYEWTIQLAPVTGLTTPTPVFTSNVAAPSVSLPNNTAADITYQIKLRVQDQCCGWSTPVYASVTVKPALLPGSIDGAQSICYNGDPTTLGNATSPSNTLGSVIYQWYYQDNCVGPWTAIASSNTTTYDPPSGLQNNRCYYREVQNCSQIQNSNTVQVTVLPDFDAGSIGTSDDTLCEPGNPAALGMFIAPSGGAGTYSYQWYYKNGANACPTGASTTGWTLISGATGNTYDPPAGLTTSRTYALQVDATGSPDCGSAKWAGGCHQTLINPAPLAFTPTVATAVPLCYRGNAKLEIASSESGIGYQLRDNTTPVGSAQTGTGSTLAFHTNNLTANSSTYNVMAITGLGCTLNVAVPAISVTAAPSALALNNDARTCYINGNNAYVEFISANGVVMAINPGTQNLGNVTVTEYVNGSPLGVQACGTSQTNQPHFNTATLSRHWTINSTVAPSANLNVRLYYSDADISALAAASIANANTLDDIAGASDLELSKYSGANENGSFPDNCGNGTVTLHTIQGTGAISLGNVGYAVTASGYSEYTISSFSELWLAGTNNVSPLPIELTSFTAVCESGKVKLRWETATEINNERFIVERSSTLQAWETVSEHPGAGNSNQPLHYQTVDERSLPGLSYYRLTQRDYDGASETFAPVSVTCYTDGHGNTLLVYPNPADDKFTVQITLAESVQGKLEITEMNGKTLLTQALNLPAGVSEFTLDRAGLQPGTYLIRLRTDKAEFVPVKLILK